MIVLQDWQLQVMQDVMDGHTVTLHVEDRGVGKTDLAKSLLKLWLDSTFCDNAYYYGYDSQTTKGVLAWTSRNVSSAVTNATVNTIDFANGNHLMGGPPNMCRGKTFGLSILDDADPAIVHDFLINMFPAIPATAGVLIISDVCLGCIVGTKNYTLAYNNTLVSYPVMKLARTISEDIRGKR